MMEETEAEYYQRREFQARMMSHAAATPRIRAIHRELADRYAQRIAEYLSDGDASRAWSGDGHVTRPTKPGAQACARQRVRPNVDAIIGRLRTELDDDRKDCDRTTACFVSELSKLEPTILTKLIDASTHHRRH